MRKEVLLNDGWLFTDVDGNQSQVHIPHTWNALDGQDGGDDYKRGSCCYRKVFAMPNFEANTQQVYLEYALVIGCRLHP